MITSLQDDIKFKMDHIDDQLSFKIKNNKKDLDFLKESLENYINTK